ncbi:hypothetical protein L210DRAFT_3580504 [Boletus edulis BED1]|uniref:Uncharacterized protein n=1 Tax=Boletus edulis BED1 TaxID=1328754 RepID=A0AAD4BCI7_BOLED|nr:hypothetical protein L210DRAFT_3580504 [Boletus edulis BED1]
MTNDVVTLAWASGLVGSMYGISLAQLVYYVWHFPKDLVSINTADILHVIGVTESHWSKLVLCHRCDPACEMDLTCFYCQRVWIITRNKCVTTTILLVAFLQLGE